MAESVLSKYYENSIRCVFAKFLEARGHVPLADFIVCDQGVAAHSGTNVSEEST